MTVAGILSGAEETDEEDVDEDIDEEVEAGGEEEEDNEDDDDDEDEGGGAEEEVVEVEEAEVEAARNAFNCPLSSSFCRLSSLMTPMLEVDSRGDLAVGLAEEVDERSLSSLPSSRNMDTVTGGALRSTVKVCRG